MTSPCASHSAHDRPGRESFTARTIAWVPARSANCSAQLFVSAMSTLLDDCGCRAEHVSRFLDAQLLLAQQDVGDPILLRHPLQLARNDLREIVGSNVRFGVVTVICGDEHFVGSVVRRAELLRTSPSIPEAIEMYGTGDCKRPVQWVCAGEVSRSRAMEPQERLLEDIVRFRLCVWPDAGRIDTAGEPSRCRAPRRHRLHPGRSAASTLWCDRYPGSWGLCFDPISLFGGQWVGGNGRGFRKHAELFSSYFVIGRPRAQRHVISRRTGNNDQMAP